MYGVIRLTVPGAVFTLLPGAFERHINSPDVEHHDSRATFTDGGGDFSDAGATVLVPVDGADTHNTI
jgi:hypothetical protein